jgi:hypothetical protein
MTRFLAALVTGAAVLASAVVSADSWPGSRPQVYASSNGAYRFKTRPPQLATWTGKSHGTLVTVHPDGLERAIWNRDLVNIPVTAYLAADGRHVVTFDTWAKLGYEHSLVIYGEQGAVVADYGLEALLSADEIRTSVPHTVSSRRWLQGASIAFDDTANSLVITLQWGKVLRVALATGRIESSEAPAAQAVVAINRARLLDGAIDVHVHSFPDDRPRSIDAIDAARLAHTRTLRAIVLKNHYDSTAGLAFIVRRIVPDIEVFGGIALNRTVGGINAAAVEHMANVSGGWGRIVWMPTFDAENQVRSSREDRPFVSVTQNGELLPAVRDVLAVIAKRNMVLATGHSAPQESLLMLREAKRLGVQRMIVTHAMNTPVSMSVAEMQEAARLGAFIEFVGGSLTATDAETRLNRYADAIRQVGPEFCVLSSDLGQRGNALPADGFGDFLVSLRRRGFTPEEVDRMAKQNPARLLGLP